ncbi:MAG: YceI family protein [Psychrobium sp.]
MKKLLLASALAGALLSPIANAADYIVDYKGAHASINFKIKHLGYSWLTGRFDKFDGKFNYDAKNPEATKIVVNIDATSINSNHAERDKHLRNDDVLDVSKYAAAKFESTSVKDLGNGKLEVKGNLTLRGVTKPVTIDAEKIGEGKDPWGGYRVGFSGTTRIKMADYGIPIQLGPDSTHVDLDLHIEGIRQ